MSTCKLFAVLIASGILAACSNTYSPEVTGETSAAINYRSVQVVERAPVDAEEVAKLSTNYAMAIRSSTDEKLEDAIERLRLQAANLGANILVIDEIKDRRTSGTIIAGALDGQVNTAVPAAPYQEVFATAYRVKD
ncbi:hypothetical protein [Pseudidiomarina aestuarii]|uniref:hypothetical protein n=1 Tax=Pseudidiomarina aestuarii TaxID=624146 RepID=UPI003A9800CA